MRSLTADISVGNPRRPALVSWSPVFAWPPPGWHSTGSTAPTELRTGGVKTRVKEDNHVMKLCCTHV